MRMWIARDKGDTPDNYVISPKKPIRERDIFGLGDSNDYVAWAEDEAIEACPRLWEKAGGLKLKPGEGPVRVDLTVKIKEA